MSKHTPGPWNNNKWNCHEHQISALGGTVALVSHSHSLISEESADANARLIAAAPDLLEACKALIELPEIHEALKSGRARTIEPLHMARAAIAKAEQA
jgi:hypothetical protein